MWLDDLISQMDESGSDAVPSSPATDSVFNPGKDSQAASSLFSTIYGEGTPANTQTMGASGPDYGGAAKDSQRANVDLGLSRESPFAAQIDSPGVLQALTKTLGLKKTSDGSIDWSDPKTIDAMMKLVMGGGSMVSSLMRRGMPQGYKSAAQLQAEIKGPLSNWTPTQQASADAFFGKPMQGSNHQLAFASNMPSPLTPGRGYADGGSINGTSNMFRGLGLGTYPGSYSIGGKYYTVDGTPIATDGAASGGVDSGGGGFGGGAGSTFTGGGTNSGTLSDGTSMIGNTAYANNTPATTTATNIGGVTADNGGGVAPSTVATGSVGANVGAGTTGSTTTTGQWQGGPSWTQTTTPYATGDTQGYNGTWSGGVAGQGSYTSQGGAVFDPATNKWTYPTGQGPVAGGPSHDDVVRALQAANAGKVFSPDDPMYKYVQPGISSGDNPSMFNIRRARVADGLSAVSGRAGMGWTNPWTGQGPGAHFTPGTGGYTRNDVMMASRDPSQASGALAQYVNNGTFDRGAAIAGGGFARPGGDQATIQSGDAPQIHTGGGLNPAAGGALRAANVGHVQPSGVNTRFPLNPDAQNIARRPKNAIATPGGPSAGFGPGFAAGGALGHVVASTGGQADVVPIRAAGGEYMMDADTVSALGDGNNAAGAAKLDVMRENIRAHKRSAPPSKIPPKAKPIAQYMGKK